MLCYDRRHSCLSPEQISDPSYHLFMHELLKNNNKIELTEQFLRNARVSIPVLFIDPPVYIFPVKSTQNITKTKQYDFLIFCINEFLLPSMLRSLPSRLTSLYTRQYILYATQRQ